MAKDQGEGIAVTSPVPGEPDYGWLMRWFDVHPRPTFIIARDLRVFSFVPLGE